jgi:hypothetical protein
VGLSKPKVLNRYYRLRAFVCSDSRMSVVEAELLPFLETLYASLYGVGSSDYEDVLARLRELPPSEWLTFTENEGFEAFQANDYGETLPCLFPIKTVRLI